MKTLGRWLMMIGLAIGACPDLSLAQEPVGVVTSLSGHATRTAYATGETPAPLRFKDGVFGADTIRTAERSFVRMLLERKAVLTVRELSVLRITEDTAQATVDLKAGGIAFSVARPRLRPGETVLVRTPNAVAAVRGTTIVVETQGAVSHFHVLTGALDVASLANPTAWQRLQAPASLTVTGAVVGAARGLDDGTRDRLNADYLSLRVADLSAPAEVVAQEQAKAVLLARLISGDGSGGDEVEMLAVADVPVTQAAPGIQSPTQVPVTPSVAPATPAATPPPPLYIWNNQAVTVTGDLYNVPATTTRSLNSGLARATGSAVTVTNEVVDITGTLTATAAAPVVELQSSTLASRTLTLVQAGRLSLTGGSLLQGVGGAVSTTDDLVRVMSGGDLFGPAARPLLNLSGTTLNVGNGTGDQLFQLTGAGSSATLAGGLLDASNTAFTLTGSSLVDVSTGAVLAATGAGPLVALSGGSLNLGNAAGLAVSSTGASQIAGSLLRTNNTAVTTTGNLVSMSGSLTDTGSAALLDLTGGAVATRNGVLVSTANGRLNLNGSALTRSGGTLTTTDDLFSITTGGRLTNTGTGALLAFSSATVDIGNAAGDQLFVVTGTGSAATLAGSVLAASATTFTLLTDDLVNVSAGGRLTAGGADPLLRFANTTANVGNGSGDQLFQLTGAGSTATLAAGLLEASNTAFTLTGSSLVDVSTGAVLTATGTGPLATLSGGSLALGNAAGFAISSTGASQIAGSLLRTTNTGVTTTGNLVTVSGSLIDTGTAALLDLTGGTVSARNGLAISSASGRLSLSGPALSRTGGTLTLTDDLVSITAGGRLTDTGAGPLLAFSNGTANIGTGAGDQLFVVNGAGSQATLAGPVLSAGNAALSLLGTALVEVSTGATLADTSAQRLVSLSGGTLTLGSAANAFLLNTSGTATLAGGLLDATGTNIIAAGDFVRALAGGRIVVTGSTAPLLSLTGGTHQFATAGNIYRLSGTTSAVDPVSGLLLGTETPIQAAGSLFEAVGATATTQRAVRLDVALLQASAPLLSLRANGAVGSGLTTTSNAIDLTSRAKLNATAPVIALDGSRITVTNASLVNVAGGSYLGVTGNLLSVANGSQISVTGGTLLFAAGGSVVNISGALLSFGGSGSTVTVSNALCPCTIIGGIPVRLSGGALAANVSITNPIQNAAGNTVSIAAGAAAVRVDGATTRVTISGQ